MLRAKSNESHSLRDKSLLLRNEAQALRIIHCYLETS